jgi:hypothetical protein
VPRQYAAELVSQSTSGHGLRARKAKELHPCVFTSARWLSRPPKAGAWTADAGEGVRGQARGVLHDLMPPVIQVV